MTDSSRGDPESATPAGVRRQEAVADLGRRVLEIDDLDDIRRDAAAVVAETIDAAYASVFELCPEGDAVALCEGVGWADEQLGAATLPTGPDTYAGDVLRTTEPVVVDEFDAQNDRSAPDLLADRGVVGGIAVVLGSPDDPWGLLSVHVTEQRPFADRDVLFVRNVATVLTSAIENAKMERRFDAIFDDPNILVGLLEPDGTVLDINETAMEYVDADLEGVVGEPFWKTPWWTDDGVQSDVKAWTERAATGEYVPFEADLTRPGGGWYTLEGVFRPVTNDDGEVVSIIVSDRDITERRRRERELEASNERLAQFAYAASHDLQEPLRMVTSYLQLLERRYADELDSDAEEFIAFAVDGAERMGDMIDALLEYSRVETRGEPLEPVDLEATLEAVRRDLELQIEESDAEITADSLPRVRGDENQLRQVFQNLLSNAIQYSGDEPPRIRVTAERADSMWRVSVGDEGIGIDPGDQERVFEVFQRLHSHEEHSGTGIGLALCRRIVERHGGEIRLDSEPGEGATFSFTLPPVDEGDEDAG